MPHIAEKQCVVKLKCCLLRIKDVQIFIGNVLSISFVLITILVGVCFFSLMQPLSAGKFVMNVFPFFDGSS